MAMDWINGLDYGLGLFEFFALVFLLSVLDCVIVWRVII